MRSQVRLYRGQPSIISVSHTTTAFNEQINHLQISLILADVTG